MATPLFPHRLVLTAAALALLWSNARADPVEVTWSTDAPGASVPADLGAGYTLFTATNPGAAGYTLTLFRLLDGAGPEDLEAALATIDLAFAGEGDPVAAINAALELAEVYGEVSVDPEGDSRMGVVLEAGRYLLNGSSESESGPPTHDTAVFTVSGPAQSEAPAADQTVRLVDFAFALPAGITAGQQTWNVVNVGQQIHHMIVFRLDEGKTMEDVTAFLETEEGEPPGQEAAHVGVLSPGRSVYVDVNLEPGNYAVICFMPDHRGDSSGTPHVMLGMLQAFTIAN